MRNRPVYSVTTAGTGLSEDQRARTFRYMWSMGVRVVCFLGSILTEGVVRWTLFLGALILPWAAVLIANAGREARAGRRTPIGDATNELH